MFIKYFSSWLTGLIDIVFSVAETGLLLRFLFRLFGANPTAEFTKFLYTSTLSF